MKLVENMKSSGVKEVEKVWFNTRDAAKYLGMSRDFLDDMRVKGRISFYVWGRTVFFKKDELDRAIEKSKVV